MRRVLVIADQWDPHADRVCGIFSDRNIQFSRLDLNPEALAATKYSLGPSGKWLEIHDERVTMESVAAVWARRTAVVLSLQQEHQEQDKGFQIWKNEWNRHLFWMYQELRNVYWLNPLVSGAVADNKLLQMRIATELGLNVPPTVSSNDRETLISFAEKHGQVALKFLSQAMISSDDGFLGLYVHRLTASELSEFGDASEQPVVLQHYISKLFEVRYTVVGAHHYVCKIDSQRSERAAVDWRRYDLGNTPHEQIEAPATIRVSVSRMMAALSIDYGAFDFIVDESGKWWFLEVNTNGQWLWIEEFTGLEISAGVASLIVEKAGL